MKAKYALHALIALAEVPSGKTLMASEIAARESIPKTFAEQILLELKRHGLVVSRRGKFGGYALAKAPEAISIGETLRLMDGPLAPLSCLSVTAYAPCSDCRNEADCKLRRLLADAAETTRGLLMDKTLADSLSAPPAVPAVDHAP